MKEGIKKILLVCGCGIATSTVVEIKLAKLLDEMGYKGKYMISKCDLEGLANKYNGYNIILSTVELAKNYNYINAISFLNGLNHEETVNQILKSMS